MSIFDRIGNLAKGKWLEHSRAEDPDAAREAELDRELEKAPRPRVSAQRRQAPPVEEEPPKPTTPIELDADGHVKRTL